MRTIDDDALLEIMESSPALITTVLGKRTAANMELSAVDGVVDTGIHFTDHDLYNIFSGAVSENTAALDNEINTDAPTIQVSLVDELSKCDRCSNRCNECTVFVYGFHRALMCKSCREESKCVPCRNANGDTAIMAVTRTTANGATRTYVGCYTTHKMKLSVFSSDDYGETDVFVGDRWLKLCDAFNDGL